MRVSWWWLLFGVVVCCYSLVFVGDFGWGEMCICEGVDLVIWFGDFINVFLLLLLMMRIIVLSKIVWKHVSCLLQCKLVKLTRRRTTDLNILIVIVCDRLSIIVILYPITNFIQLSKLFITIIVIVISRDITTLWTWTTIDNDMKCRLIDLILLIWINSDILVAYPLLRR